jgi:hypothetical protein
MSSSPSSYQLMNPIHSIETAYTEWVIKCIEIIIQSRVRPPVDSPARPSRQFALVMPERFGVRGRVLQPPGPFLTGSVAVLVEILSDGSPVEEWRLTFDSPRDVLPSDRVYNPSRDQTLPRRLAVALRSVMTLTRVLPAHGTEGLKFRLSETPEGPPGSPARGEMSQEVVSVQSSIGVLGVRLVYRQIGRPSPRMSPSPPPVLRLDETFIQTHSLGGIEMVIEPVTPSVPQIVSTPPRDLRDIWPTSALSASSSPFNRSSFTDGDDQTPPRFSMDFDSEEFSEKSPEECWRDLVDFVEKFGDGETEMDEPGISIDELKKKISFYTKN